MRRKRFRSVLSNSHLLFPATMARWTGKVPFACGAVCRDNVLAVVWAVMELHMIATRRRLQKLTTSSAHKRVPLAASWSVAISALMCNFSPMPERSFVLDGSCRVGVRLSIVPTHIKTFPYHEGKKVRSSPQI